MSIEDCDVGERLARLERRLRAATMLAIVTASVGVVGIGLLASGHVDAAPRGDERLVVDRLRVRVIDVVDEKGVTRVKIAAPLPNAAIKGRTLTRGGKPEDTVSGILLFDAEGVERSGYATVDRGYSNVMLTLDDKRQQHALFIAEPTGATTLRLFNGPTRDRVDVAVDNDGPSITMVKNGKEVYRLPAR